MAIDLFKKLSGRNYHGIVRGFVLFAMFFLYIWLKIDPRLIYHSGGEIEDFPVFFTTWAFFNELAWHPGGLIEYISAFLSQFLYYSLAGAIVLTIHALLVCVCFGCFLKAVKAARFHFVSFIPAIVLLVIYNKYTYHFASTTALLAGLFFLCLYIKTAPRSKPLSVFFFLLLSTVLYIIAGGAYLLFAAVCGIYEVLFRRRLLTGVVCFLSAGAIPYLVGVIVFNVSMIDAYSELLPISWKILTYPDRKVMIEAVYALYLLLPVFLIVLGLWRFFAAKPALPLDETAAQKAKTKKKRKKKRGRKYSIPGQESPSRGKWAIDFELMAVFVIAGTALFLFRDYGRKTMFEIDYCACQGNWNKVLSVKRGYPYNYLVIHTINRALYHTGRLPYDMFRYPQHPRALMLSSKQDMFEHWRRFSTYYDLGTMNHCECALVESLELYGERPEILKRLAIVSMARNNIESARVYLGALSNTLFYSGWADNYLDKLRTDPMLSEDEEIQRLRSLMPEKDKGSIGFPVEEIFSDLLEKNEKNQMAFEYLMAWYILNGQLEKFAQNISRLNDFDYPEIPRCYEEALLTYMYTHRKRVKLPGYEISVESQERFNQFLLASNKYGTNKEAALGELAAKFSDTYFFYYVYFVTGIKK